MNISHLSKAKVLAALYNNSKPLGMGAFHGLPGNMSEEEATKLLEDDSYFDYVYGRVLKVDLSGDELNTSLYNRDLGEGAAERAIASIC